MKEERRMILQMIEDGKITADEGIALLEALEKTDVEELSSRSQAKGEAGSKANANESTQDQSEAKHKQHTEQDSNFEEFTHKARKFGEEAVEQSKIVGNKIGDLVEKFINKVKDLDFDFSFGNVVKVEKVLEGKPPESGVIDLTTINGKVEIMGWDKEEYHIGVIGAIRAENQLEANAILNEILHVEETSSALTIAVEQSRGTKISLEVCLPKKLLRDIKVKTSNGAIEIEDLQVEGAKLETSNGPIRIEGLHSKGLYCDTSNGRIAIEESHIDELYARTSNGQVRLDGTISKAKCFTSNGSIRYTLKEVKAGELDFETTNGAIEVKLPLEGLSVKGELKTSHGSLDCTLPKIEITSATKEISNRYLRFQSIEEAGEPFAIVCNTKNGGIRIHPFSE